MTLLQQTLERIEHDASQETKSALRFADLIDECERITQRLNDAAVDTHFNPIVTTYSHVEGVCVRAYVYYGHLDQVRAAIADAGLTIADESTNVHQNTTKLTLDGLTVYVEVSASIEEPLKAAA